jgi:hypothetical protein
MIKINDGERDALEDIFIGFSNDGVRLIDKIVLFFKGFFLNRSNKI